jgi:hypothetical protein
MDHAVAAQGQVAKGRTDAGRASASGASDGVIRNRPQRARERWRRASDGSALMHCNFFNRTRVLRVDGRLSRCRLGAEQVSTL